MPPDPIWQLESLSAGYAKARPAVHEVHATAHAGRLVAVLGPNAAGKTTLLRAMLGSLRPTQGQARLRGKPSHRIGAADLAQQLAWVPQSTADALGFSVAELVGLGLTASGEKRTSPQSAQRQHDALRLADVQDLVARPIGRLSAGQRQRVVLARALAQCGPRCVSILADEPTAALDPPHAHAVLGVLRGLTRRADGPVSVVAVLHDLDLAAAYADDAWLMSDGKLVAAGPVGEVLTPERLEQAYGAAFTRDPPPDDRRAPRLARPALP
ncbi:MAG: ABC transporter ATP-binding protein [Planctomycetota bacterium]